LPPITLIIGWSAPIKEVATARLEPAHASLVMMVLLVSVLPVLITVMIVEHAGQRESLLIKPAGLTTTLGMPTSTLDAFVMQATEGLAANCRSAPRARILLTDMVTRPDVTARVGESATTTTVLAVASLVITAPVASS